MKFFSLFITEAKTFTDSIKWLVYFGCLIGMGGFRLPNQSKRTFLWIQFYTVCSNIVTIAVVFIGFTAIPLETLDFQDTSPAAVRIYANLVYANATVALILPLIIWLRREDLTDCLQRSTEFLEQFGEVFHLRIDYSAIRTQVFRLLISAIGIASVVTAYDIFIYMNRFTGTWPEFCIFILALHHPLVPILITDLLFSIFVQYLRIRFQDLNAVLSEMTKTSSSGSFYGRGKRIFVVSKNSENSTLSDTRIKSSKSASCNNDIYLLQEIRKAHFELCIICRRVNLTFGAQNLISSGLSLIVITGFLYTIYSAIAWDKSWRSTVMEVIPSMIWCSIYGVKIFIVNYICSMASNESSITGVKIYELLKTKTDRKFQIEVQTFALQMMQTSVQFNACGFFNLDFTLMQKVIGAVTTYLVILIQMNGLTRKDTAAVNHSSIANSTRF